MVGSEQLKERYVVPNKRLPLKSTLLYFLFLLTTIFLIIKKIIEYIQQSKNFKKIIIYKFITDWFKKIIIKSYLKQLFLVLVIVLHTLALFLVMFCF